MSDVPSPRFALSRITTSEWAVNDLRYRADDPRHVVACVYEVAETEVEVVWLRELPLSSRYGTAFEVLADVERLQELSRATRPVPIPHLPPLLST